MSAFEEGHNEVLYNPFDENDAAEINSLSVYIQLFELFTHNKNLAKDVHMGHFDVPFEDYAKIEGLLMPNYILRGEHSDFKETATTAGAFRYKTSKELFYSEIGTANSIFNDFRIAKDAYYREVGHRLSEVERENFTAFSQHHGLVTNLLDVTYAPLTALFMACDKQDNEPAYVYIFEDYIDVTEVLEKFPEQNIVDLLCSQEKYAVTKLFDAILKQSNQYQFRQSSLLNCMKDLIDNIYESTITHGVSYSDLNFKKSDDAINATAKCLKCINEPLSFKNIDILRQLIKLITETGHIELDIKYYSVPEELAYIYLVLLVFYLRRANKKGIGKYMPYMVYRPKLTFERARLQQGFFIIQPFKSLYKNNNGIMLMQDIKHTKSIQVNNPSLILQQLNAIGINKGMMYGDFDNIAKYIRSKY